jgi:hypothetical protein
MAVVGICSITRFSNSRVVGSVQCKSSTINSTGCCSACSKYSPQELRSEFRWLRRAEFREQFCFRVRPLNRLRVTIELIKIGLELLL